MVPIPKLGVDSESEEDEVEWPVLGAECSTSNKLKADFQEVTIDEKDEETLNTFMNLNPPNRRCLAVHGGVHFQTLT